MSEKEKLGSLKCKHAFSVFSIFSKVPKTESIQLHPQNPDEAGKMKSMEEIRHSDIAVSINKITFSKLCQVLESRSLSPDPNLTF